MKILKMLTPAFLSLFFVPVYAQTEAPKGFVKGKVILADRSVVSGFIKDRTRNDATLVVMSEGREKTYSGYDLLSAQTEDNEYLCIKGDFFKVMSKGQLNFLQKSSNASSRPTYNGNEVLFISGTEGKAGDYFLYDNNSQELKLVSRKNLNAVISATFGSYSPAAEKARSAQGNIAGLKEAVDVYNNRKGI
jgi:hypothetical protein